jgi:hypothetical protein
MKLVSKTFVRFLDLLIFGRIIQLDLRFKFWDLTLETRISDPGQLLQKDQAPSDHSCGALCQAETLPKSLVTSSAPVGTRRVAGDVRFC